MSSTNRGGKREVSDYYITPQWAILDFLHAFTRDVPNLLSQPLTILDPCAGGDKNNNMAYPTAITTFAKLNVNTLYTIDSRLDSKAITKSNYLSQPIIPPLFPSKPNIIITNPPFSHSLEITQKALQDVAENGFVVMLQRLNWLGSKKRISFWKNTLPQFIYVHHERISFIHGSTDSIEYAHFVFHQGSHPSHSQLQVI